MDERGAKPWPLVALLGGITLVGFLLRLTALNDALLGDELSTYFIASSNTLGGAIDLVRSDLEVTPPLYFAIAWLTDGIGDPSTGLRIAPMIAGVAAIPMTALLGAWTVGRRAAVVGAALIALSPFLILESADARAHPVMLALALASTLALVRATETRRTGWWVAYAAFSLATVWTHYTAVFVLAAQIAWALWRKPDSRFPLIASNIAVAVGYLPWLVTGFPEDQNSPGNLIEILHPFSLDSARTDLGQWAIGQSYAGTDVVPGVIGVALIAVGIGVALVGLAMAVERRGGGSAWWPSDGTLLVIMIGLATPVGAILYSALLESLLTSRNLIASWPGLALTVGALVTAPRQPLRTVATALVLAGFAIGAAKMLDPDNGRPEYKVAADYIDSFDDPTAPVVDQPWIYTANPVSPLEVALNDPGQSIRGRHPVFRVNVPTRAQQERARARGLPPVYLLKPPSTKRIFERATRLAGDGDLFVVTPQPPEGAGDLEAPVLAAVPRGWDEVDSREFAGVRPVTVRVFRDGAS